jgi:hypothetical protein
MELVEGSDKSTGGVLHGSRHAADDYGSKRHLCYSRSPIIKVVSLSLSQKSEW